LAVLEHIRMMGKLKQASVAEQEAAFAQPSNLQPIPQEPVMQTQGRRDTVRHAARMLEEAAAMLEEASEYDQADKVRQTASELWRAARR